MWFEGVEDHTKHLLSQVVSAHAGSVVASVTEATHIIFPEGSTGQTTEEKQYWRVVERLGDKTLLHWWFFPDSYDVWTASKEEYQTQPMTSVRPWRVTTRWIHDSHKFNEWMNEHDYVYDEVREKYLVLTRIRPQMHHKRVEEGKDIFQS